MQLQSLAAPPCMWYASKMVKFFEVIVKEEDGTIHHIHGFVRAWTKRGIAKRLHNLRTQLTDIAGPDAFVLRIRSNKK